MASFDIDDVETCKKILRFFRSKRNMTSGEVDHEVTQLRAARLQEEMYNVDDIEEMLEDLNQSLQGTVREHMERTAFMAILLVRQLLHGGAREGIDLMSSINLPQLEDHAALSEISKIRIDAPPSEVRKKKGKADLISIKDEHKRALEKIRDLEESNEIFREKHSSAVEQCKTLQVSRKDLKSQLKMMKKALSQLRASLKKERKAAAAAAAAAVKRAAAEKEGVAASAAAAAEAVAESYALSGSDSCSGVTNSSAGKPASKHADSSDASNDASQRRETTEGKTSEGGPPSRNHAALASENASSSKKIEALLLEMERAKERINRTDKELGEIRGASNKRVATSKQFQQLRRMLGRKNDQLRALRTRLNKYEPEEVSKIADGDSSSCSSGDDEITMY